MHSKELLENGYAVIKNLFLETETKRIEFLLSAYTSKINASTFKYSLLELNEEDCMFVSRIVTSSFKEKLSSFFSNNFKFISGSFLIKPLKEKSELPLHQDWSYIDEKKFNAITCWMPLINTDENTGGMFLLKRSHSLGFNIRSYDYPTDRVLSSKIKTDFLTHVNIKKGDVLLFNPKIWHGSSANISDNNRLVITCLILPKAAQLTYYYKKSDFDCMPYMLPDNGFELYLRYLAKGIVPSELKPGNIFSYTHRINSEQLTDKFV